MKYGVNENLECRFITQYLGESLKVPESPATHTHGFSSISLGAKIRLADEKGAWPHAALIGHINLKTGHKEFMPDYTAADFRFTFSHTLSDQWSLSYNLGATWNGKSPEAVFLYTLSFAYLITDKFTAFAEGYSFFPEASKADHRFDGGFTYKFTPVLQFDVSGGVGLSENAPDFFVSTGASFRLFR